MWKTLSNLDHVALSAEVKSSNGHSWGTVCLKNVKISQILYSYVMNRQAKFNPNPKDLHFKVVTLDMERPKMKKLKVLEYQNIYDQKSQMGIIR